MCESARLRQGFEQHYAKGETKLDFCQIIGENDGQTAVARPNRRSGFYRFVWRRNVSWRASTTCNQEPTETHCDHASYEIMMEEAQLHDDLQSPS